MARAEPAMDRVFCVFAKVVCSLSLSPDHKAMLFLAFESRCTLGACPIKKPGGCRVFTNLHPTGLHLIQRLVTRLFTGDQRNQRQYRHRGQIEAYRLQTVVGIQPGGDIRRDRGTEN